MANDGVIDEVKGRLDIVEVVSAYLQLKKAGTSHRAVCPFHQEKTPSFFVSQDKQIWHCFGCGEGGDVFGFVMRMEGLEFPDALRLLAQKAGVKLRRSDDKGRDERRRILETNRMAARFWHEVLRRSPKAEDARAYVKRRGLEETTLEDFLIGYAPDSWDATSSFLMKKGFTEDELAKAGLVAKRERGTGHYDKFRGRLMFAIRDVHGDIVGFTGRTLPGPDGKDPDAPKYVNTQQTAAYNKSRVLFGLDAAKQEIRKEGLAVVVEGNMDVIASHQAGVRNVVASSGTALTTEQLDLLKRFTDRLVLSFDDDAAGENAARRGIDAAIAAGFSVRILRLPEDSGKDPDDCIRTKGVETWKKAVADAVPHLQWYLDLAAHRTDFGDSESKRRAAAALVAEISKLPQAVERSHWTRELSRMFDTPESSLFEEIERMRKPSRNEGASGAAGLAAPPSARKAVMPKERGGVVAEHVLAAALYRPEFEETVVTALTPDEFPPDHADLYRDLVLFYNDHRQGGERDATTFRLSLEARGNQDAARRAAVLELLGEKEFGSMAPDEMREALSTLIGELKRLHTTRRQKELLRAMAEAERVGDAARIEEVQRQLNDLI